MVFSRWIRDHASASEDRCFDRDIPYGPTTFVPGLVCVTGMSEPQSSRLIRSCLVQAKFSNRLRKNYSGT